ncbi:hypothetical protein HMPREF1546_03621 [Oscillibacter sp. KLE 1745]|nr:hypothetical protein HMPREF1546_03621 [Oscillibacter sp. KLE 1745]
MGSSSALIGLFTSKIRIYYENDAKRSSSTEEDRFAHAVPFGNKKGKRCAKMQWPVGKKSIGF